MSITNKESLRDYIHSVHDFIRNCGAGYGLTALRIFNLFFGLKIIEDNKKGLFDKLFIPYKLRKNEFVYHVDKINTFFKYSKLDITKKDKFEKMFIENSNIENDEEYEMILNSFKNIFKFSNLVKYAIEPEKFEIELLIETIDGPILDFLSEEKSKMKEFLFYEIPKLKNKVYCDLIKKISLIGKNSENSNVDDTNFQLAGKIYEYFIGRDESAISELGAYFTDRYIVNYILDNILMPSLNEDGTVKSVIDPFGGSGGFILGYLEYLNKNNENIDWEKNIHKIYHQDMSVDVVKSASLETLCITGEIPAKYNFKVDNSFTSTFDNLKYDYILTNPPYGGDKAKKSEEQKKRELLKKYINKTLENKNLDSEVRKVREQQIKDINKKDNDEKEEQEKAKVNFDSCSYRIKDFCRKYGLKPTDKEGCSFVLIMDLLAPNGTAVGVLKEGVFFDKKYSNIRKVLIENYNVTKIVSIESDAFENTTTKTSIILFHNTEEKTTNIDFYDLVIEKEKDNVFEELEDGTVILSKCKGDIISISDVKVASANINKIITKEYSLNYKFYEKSKIECNKGYHFEKLKDICSIKRGSPLNNDIQIFKNKNEKNIYPIYGSGDIIGYTNQYNRNENTCIISRVGGPKSKNCSKLLTENFYLTDAAFSLETYKHTYMKKYIDLYFLYDYDNIFVNSSGGTCQYTINQETLYNLNIPIPNDLSRIDYWSNIIGEQFDLINSSKKEINEIEQNVMNEINRICNEEECSNKNIESLCDIDYGTRVVKNNNIEGNIKVYGGGDISFTTNKSPNRTGFNVLISRFGMSKKCVRIIYDDIFLNDSGLSLTIFDINFKKYISYYLYLNQIDIFNIGNKTAQKNLDINLFKKYIIKIPKNTQLIDNLKPQFDRLEELHLIHKEAQKRFDELTLELKKDAIIEVESDIIVGETSEEESNINNINDNQNDDNQSVTSKITTISSKSTISDKSLKKSEEYPEFDYVPIKSTVENFNEIKTRLNNGKDIKIKCPCNNDIIFMTKTWEEHRKLDIHKEYLKNLFPTEKKSTKYTKKNKVTVV